MNGERGFSPSSAAWREVLELDAQFMHGPWNEQQWQQLDSKNDVIFLLTANATVIGFALYRLAPLDGLAHLLKVVVHPDHRQKRRGFEFCQQTFSWLRSEQIKRIFLEVASNNLAALGLYGKLGFTKLHLVKGFYSNGLDAWTMEMSLDSSI